MKLLSKNITKIILFIFVISVTISSCSDEDENLPQVVSNFTYTVNNNTGTVTFLNISENADSYLWDFGDETSSTEKEPIKTFENGSYPVSLTALNSAGAADIFTDTLTILIREVVSIPITFDAANTNYEAQTFEGAEFEIVANPDQSGSNDKSTNVGAITNNGAAFEGIYFDLGSNLELDTEKSITMSFWSESAIDVLVKLEEGDGPDVEAPSSHSGSGWESITFDFESSDSFSRFTMFVDGPGTTEGTFYFDDVIQSATVDTTPPVITLIGDATVAVVTGNSYVDLGATAIDNVDGDISESIVVDESAVDTNTEGNYEVTYNVTDAAGNAATEVIRTVVVSDADLVKPVITLVGEDPFQFITGDTFNDPGATAADNTDGDITSDIVVTGNVDSNTAGTYTLTYNVSDAAGNAADPVTREVIVGLINGDFQTGDGTGWFGNALDVRTDDGTEYYNFANVLAAGEPFDANLSQEVNLVQGQTYTLSFEASSDVTRTLVVGMGQNFGDFEADTTWITINDTPTVYDIELTTSADVSGTPFGGDESNRILFDMGADVGVVVIDKVSLTAGSGGGSGGGGGGGGGSVDGNLAINGDFETGDGTTGWLFFNNGGTAEVDNTISSGGGSASGKVSIVGPGNPAVKQERVGAGEVSPGDVVQITLDHQGSVAGEGGFLEIILVIERPEGQAGDPITQILTRPTLGNDWASYSDSFAIPGAAETGGGISLELVAICGGAVGCEVSANVDNISIVLNP